MNIEAVNDRAMNAAGDYSEADLWDAYMEVRASEYRQANGAYSVPSKELIKQWAREAAALTQEQV